MPYLEILSVHMINKERHMLRKVTDWARFAQLTNGCAGFKTSLHSWAEGLSPFVRTGRTRLLEGYLASGLSFQCWRKQK